MGCWNATCYISKLPIWYDEPVVMILVRETYEAKQRSPHTCYTTDKYVPFGYPVYGKYDDYGGVDDIDNEDEILEYLNTVTICDSNGEAVEITKENLRDVLNEFSHGESGYTVNKFNIEAFLVKRDLYDLLISNAKSRKIYNKEETIEQQTKRLLKKELNELYKKNIPDDELILWRLSDIRVAKISIYDMSEDISSYLKKKLYDNFNDHDLDKLVEIVMFRDVLEYLRMGYFCISGDGSQSGEMYMHTLVAKYILDFAEKSFREAQDDTREEINKDEYLKDTDYGYYESDSE